MKLLLIAFFLIPGAFAWELTQKGEETLLVDKEAGINEAIVSGPGSKEVQVKKLEDDLVLVTYLEGHAGTKTVTKVYNCALYSPKTKKLIFKDVLCKSIEGKSVTEAKFTRKGNKLEYAYEELTEDYVLP